MKRRFFLITLGLAASIIRDSRNGRYPSDHYFLSAEVTLAPQAAAK